MKLLRMCPDCDCVIAYNTHCRAFMHDNQSDCAYMEDINGERIWNNKTRKGDSKQLEEKSCEDDEQLSLF